MAFPPRSLLGTPPQAQASKPRPKLALAAEELGCARCNVPKIFPPK